MKTERPQSECSLSFGVILCQNTALNLQTTVIILTPLWAWIPVLGAGGLGANLADFVSVLTTGLGDRDIEIPPIQPIQCFKLPEPTQTTVHPGPVLCGRDTFPLSWLVWRPRSQWPQAAYRPQSLLLGALHLSLLHCYPAAQESCRVPDWPCL